MMTSIEVVLNYGDGATQYVPVKEASRLVGMKVVPTAIANSSSATIVAQAPSNSSANILVASMSSVSAGTVVTGSYASSIADATKFQVFDDSTPIPIVFSSGLASTIVTLQLTVDPFVIGARTALSSSA